MAPKNKDIQKTKVTAENNFKQTYPVNECRFIVTIDITH